MSKLIDLQLASTFVITASSVPFIDYGYEFDIFKLYFIILYISIDTLRIMCTSRFLYDSYFYHHITTLAIVRKVFDNEQCIHLCNHPLFLESSAFLYILTRKYNCYKQLSKVYWLFDRLVRFPLAIVNIKSCAQHFIVELSVLIFLSSYWSFEMLKIRNLSFCYMGCFFVAYFFFSI